MGLDTARPFANFPTSVAGGGATSHYADYYYRSTGQRIAFVGGAWNDGSAAGLSYWGLNFSSGNAGVSIGARLVRKGG